MSTSMPIASARPVLADLVPGAVARDALLIVSGAGLTGLFAQIAIPTPLSPVPFTLQTLAVLLVGSALGPARGIASMALYLVAGMAGVPWFAEHSSGWASPSFGYIIGFLLGAGLAGYLARRGADRRLFGTVALMIVGNIVIYVLGATWLAVDLGLSVDRTLELGVTPFLIGDAIKLAVAAAVLPAVWRALRNHNRV